MTKTSIKLLKYFYKMQIKEWGRCYREFVKRQRFLGRWPFQTDGERKAAWLQWKLHTVYDVAD